jgi:SAM-dependent methyltransferase
MDETIRSALAEINRTFYAGFAGDFARTRRGWPLGFERILPHLRSAANVLDVGCGNGRLLPFLTGHGWCGHYLGIDGSASLLASAEENLG